MREAADDFKGLCTDHNMHGKEIDMKKTRTEGRLLKTIPALMIGLTIAFVAGSLVYINLGRFTSRRSIDGLEETAGKVADITIPENTRVYALGEATHGNAEFQELKLSVFKKLVEEDNYKVFGIEECFGPGLKIDMYIQGRLEGVTSEDLVKEMGCTIYHTSDIAAVIDYMKEYNTNVADEEKLHFYGFDMQGLSGYEIDFLADTVERLTEGSNLRDEMLGYVEAVRAIKADDFKVTRDNKETLLSEYNSLKDFLTEQNTDDDYDINMSIHTLDIAIGLMIYYDKEVEYADKYNFRDRTMAENVKWYDEILERKGQRGILVTAHNGHVACYADDEQVTFGGNLRKLYNDQLYIVGTEYYYTVDNINDHSYYSYEYTRRNHKFCSTDVVAYQAKNYDDGAFFLDYDKVSENTELYDIISNPNIVGGVGEGYMPDNDFCQDNQRDKLVMKDCYDGVVYYYSVNPIEVLD